MELKVLKILLANFLHTLPFLQMLFIGVLLSVVRSELAIVESITFVDRQ